ncbi:hypothetical protein GCM10022206_93730 [Streptomyces chiangmaiensis]
MLRCEPAVFGPVASDPTVSRLIDVLTASGEKALQAIRSARSEVRNRVWSPAGKHAPDAGGQVTVDLDGALVLGCVLAGSTRSARLGNMQRMAIKLENVGIAVRDLEATIAFFTDLGLTVVGRDTVSGEWTDTAVGLDGNHANIAMLQTPDGHGRLELFEYIHPEAIESKPTRPNEIGMHRVAFSVDDIDKALETAAKHGCRPLRGVATYEDVYKLTYVRGPSGILVMLAEELKKN